MKSADSLLRQLEYTVLKRLDGLLQGDYRTWSRGQGVDLADLREYQPHDDVRHIDWNVTARLDVPHVRRYIEDRDLTCWFLLDATASVDFGSEQTTKLDLAAGFVGVLARVLTRHGNRVGALRYTGKVDTVLPPRSNRTQVLHVINALRRPAPKNPQGTALADLLRSAESLVRRRSLVFIVSDFISAPGWEAPLARLAQRHEVLAVRLNDGADVDLPAWGLVTLEDAETGEQLFVDAGDATLRRRYTELAAQAEDELVASLQRSGADTLELATGDDLLEALLRFAHLRRQRARVKPSVRWPRGTAAAAGAAS